jgi:hypothetical protein
MPVLLNWDIKNIFLLNMASINLSVVNLISTVLRVSGDLLKPDLENLEDRTKQFSKSPKKIR